MFPKCTMSYLHKKKKLFGVHLPLGFLLHVLKGPCWVRFWHLKSWSLAASLAASLPPKNGWLEDYFPFLLGFGNFSGAFAFQTSGGYIHINPPQETRNFPQKKIPGTLKRSQRVYTWKWVVGIRSFPLGAFRPIFRRELIVSGSVYHMRNIFPNFEEFVMMSSRH